MNGKSRLDSLSAHALKAELEGMGEHERYEEIMRRFQRGEAIPRQFQFFVSFYEGAHLQLGEDEQTFRISEKMYREHEEWMEMMHKRWKQGGCGDILPFVKKP